ncbi:MAG: hypothetical protein E7314_06085 [Clostridiales bacterium]|nr:hypothetical protein [Clostridiales bacterium]
MKIRIDRIKLLIITAIFAFIVFGILTLIQNKLINYEEQIKVFVANTEIKKETKLDKDNFDECYLPQGLAKELNVLSKIPTNMYTKTDMYKGQFLIASLIGTKEELKIIEGGENKEKISIELGNGASMLSYQIKRGDKVNLYFTGKYEVIEKMVDKFPNVLIGNLSTVQILNDEEILGIYDKNGVSSENEEFLEPSTVIFGVTRENAEIINNFRTQGEFYLTM